MTGTDKAKGLRQRDPGHIRRSLEPLRENPGLAVFVYLILLFFTSSAAEMAAAALGGGGRGIGLAIGVAFGDEGVGALLPVVLSDLAILAVTVGVTALFLRLLEDRPFRAVGFERVRGWPAHAGLGVLLETGHLGLLFGLGCLAGWYRVQAVEPLARAAPMALSALALALPLAMVEEVIFRGYVLRCVEKSHGTTHALLFSSAMFAAIHLANPDGARLLPMVGLFLAGIYLGAAYLATRQLWLPVAMHAAWNAVEGPVLGLPVSGHPQEVSVLRVDAGGPELWTGGAFGPEAGLPVLFTTVLFTGIVWVVGRRLRGEEAGPGS